MTVCAVACALGPAAAWFAGFRLNLSASIPVGLYREQIVARDRLRRGDVILTCLPEPIAAFARDRGYLPRGTCPSGVMPVGKVVLALPGDTVSLTAENLVINGIANPANRPLARDRSNRPLPRLSPFTNRIPNGELWLGSRSYFGFDSRYFGSVAVVREVRRLEQVWTGRAR